MQEHRAQRGNRPAGGLRMWQRLHSGRGAEKYLLLGDDNQRLDYGFDDMFGIFDDVLWVGVCRK
jgi:hypothetical protein